jgi:hypothetical protein
VTYSAVAGYGCPQDASRGYHEVGNYSDGIAGWYKVGTGGWRQNGCNGSFDAVPMSGSATQDDGGIRALWWFRPGTASRHCAVSVYVPTPSHSRDVAGNPAKYYVLRDLANDWYGSFAVNQVQNRGRWVPAGTYPVSGGEIVIKLVNRGVDFSGSTNTYAHLAAAQVRISCTA